MAERNALAGITSGDEQSLEQVIPVAGEVTLRGWRSSPIAPA